MHGGRRWTDGLDKAPAHGAECGMPPARHAVASCPPSAAGNRGIAGPSSPPPHSPGGVTTRAPGASYDDCDERFLDAMFEGRNA